MALRDVATDNGEHDNRDEEATTTMTTPLMLKVAAVAFGSSLLSHSATAEGDVAKRGVAIETPLALKCGATVDS